MPKTDKQPSANEREIHAVLKSRGKSLREIAEALNRSPSTLSWELKRNAPGSIIVRENVSDSGLRQRPLELSLALNG